MEEQKIVYDNIIAIENAQMIEINKPERFEFIHLGKTVFSVDEHGVFDWNEEMITTEAARKWWELLLQVGKEHGFVPKRVDESPPTLQEEESNDG